MIAGTLQDAPVFFMKGDMMIGDNGLFDLPDGKIASIVTSLEMIARPDIQTAATNGNWRLDRINHPQTGWYRELFSEIGSDWLWFSRIVMPDNELAAILSDPKIEVHTLMVDGVEQGLLELDYRTKGECELAFLGLTSAMTGKGAGRWLMNNALKLAWSKPIKRLWIHTCTLDHPAALPLYIRSGFVPYMRQLEIADDPRVTGTIAPHFATHYPLLAKAR